MPCSGLSGCSVFMLSIHHNRIAQSRRTVFSPLYTDFAIANTLVIHSLHCNFSFCSFWHLHKTKPLGYTQSLVHNKITGLYRAIFLKEIFISLSVVLRSRFRIINFISQAHPYRRPVNIKKFTSSAMHITPLTATCRKTLKKRCHRKLLSHRLWARLDCFIFIVYGDRHIAHRINTQAKSDWPAAHLAILNILLTRFLMVYQNSDRLSAVRTTHYFF